MRIEICGGIASGKTTLSRSLGRLGYSCVYEDVALISPLADFYHDPERYVFETEMTFLVQHLYQAKKALGKENRIVCDYSFEQDFAYARNNLSTEQMQVFESAYHEMLREIGKADLVIYLNCDPNILHYRIRARGRKGEESVTISYLRDTIGQVLGRLGEIDSPVIRLDSGECDFRELDTVRTLVLPVIQGI